MSKFDHDALDGLISGDTGLLVELVDLFCIDWREIMGRIHGAVRRGDAPEVELLAHRLKGMVRNFFAAKAAELSGEIENMGREKKVALVSDRLPALEAELEALEIELIAYKDARKS